MGQPPEGLAEKGLKKGDDLIKGDPTKHFDESKPTGENDPNDEPLVASSNAFKCPDDGTRRESGAKTSAANEGDPGKRIQPLEPEAIEEEPKPKLAVIASALPPPNPIDQVVEQFIQYDIGQLRGSSGEQARSAFNRLGTESVPALIRGLNRAACLAASCPVIVLTQKLHSVLPSCGPEMTELAVGQLGVGVPSTAPHYYSLERLKQQLFGMLPADHPLRRRIELAVQLTADPARIPRYVRSVDPNDRWAAARAIVMGGAPLGDELIQLLGDAEPVIVQEARTGLMRLSGNKDFGPDLDADPAARERALADWRSWWFKRSTSTIFRRVSRLTDEELRAALQSRDAEERWAAVVTVGNRRLPCAAGLIGLLRDPDMLVRRDARKTLVQLAGGSDFGPADDAPSPAVEEAIAKWQQWRRMQELIAKFEVASREEVTAGFAKGDSLERLAAVRVARGRKLDCPEAFIQTLGDPQSEICQEARHALVQISGGSDFGPSENAGREAVEASVARWQRWLRWHRLVVAYESKTAPELLEVFRSPEPLERWAAVSVSRRQGLRPGAALIPLLRDDSADVQQEARQALVELGGGDYDFGPPENGDSPAVERSVERWTAWWQREAILPQLAGLPPQDLVVAFRSPEVPRRWAAVAAARRVRAPLHAELIQLVKDADGDVRQEARRALVQLAGGSDFGPAEDADARAVDQAEGQWENWWASEQQRREAAAGNALKLARIVLDKNPNAGRRRLHEVVTQFAGTQAAQTAQNLLDKVAQVAPREDQPREKSASADARRVKRKSDLVAEPDQKVTPEQLEKEAALMLRLAKVSLSHRPAMFRERLQELIERYPGTKAAQEGQRLLNADSGKPAATGDGRKKD
ncbi:MAG TPA: hypothetical protein PLF81_27680 [Candidatus Anammoximicrobium sp.]|nr:hypothetical protein [Candidatus Anammoximicrobium sp.]